MNTRTNQTPATLQKTNPFTRPRYLERKTPSKPADFPVKLQPLQIAAGLEPFPALLSEKHAAHLLRRARMGANPNQITAFAGLSATDASNLLIARATDTSILPLPEPPAWADTPPPSREDPPEVIQAYIENNATWIEDYLGEMFALAHSGGLREKMLMMWHNHFVTGIEAYALATLAYRYISLLRTHCLGNFKNFVYDMGLTPAMLLYLNGNTNEKTAPNENYGRELLELFTMGPVDREEVDNYTQSDIQEIARALTGFVINFQKNSYEFISDRHDADEKTFFGRTGNFGYDEVIDILFEERPNQIAYFVCAKIYQAFVYDLPDDEIVQDLAVILLANNFEIAPVVQALLQSAHFFDDQVIGAKIKSPMDLITGTMLEVDFTPSQTMFNLFSRGTDILDQTLLNPPNVAGWPGHRFWVSTTTLPLRWLVSDFLLYSVDDFEPLNLVHLARLFPEGEAADSAFSLPLALAKHLIAVHPSELDIGEVDAEFGGDLVTFPIPDEVKNGPAYAQNLAKIFLNGIPWYEWSLDEDGANILLLNFVRYLTQLPEYHLT